MNLGFYQLIRRIPKSDWVSKEKMHTKLLTWCLTYIKYSVNGNLGMGSFGSWFSKLHRPDGLGITTFPTCSCQSHETPLNQSMYLTSQPLLSESATFTHIHVYLPPLPCPWDRSPRVLNLRFLGISRNSGIHFRSANLWCLTNYLIIENLDHLLPLNNIRFLSGTFWTPQEMMIFLNTNTFSFYTFCPRFFHPLTWKVNTTERKKQDSGVLNEVIVHRTCLLIGVNVTRASPQPDASGSAWSCWSLGLGLRWPEGEPHMRPFSHRH